MLVNLSEQEILILVNAIRSFRPAWDSRAIRAVVEELAATGMTAAEVANIGIFTAQDQQYRTPSAMIFLAKDRQEDIVRETVEHNPLVCEICGRSQKACRKAQENQLKIFNDVRARHPKPGGIPESTDPRHEFVPHVQHADTIMGEERAVTIEDLRRKLPKARPIPDHLPYVPPDLLGDAVAGRATADDQETGESTS